MTTGTSSVAVVATSAARTDRRALSQAWYSALHLAQTATPRPPRARIPAAASGAPLPATPGRSAGPRRAAAERLQKTHAHAVPRKAPPAIAAPARSDADLARRIERAVLRRPPARAAVGSTAFAIAGGRVRLFVRTDGGTTRIIALCPMQLREPVERALAHARLALHARGVRIGTPA